MERNRNIKCVVLVSLMWTKPSPGAGVHKSNMKNLDPCNHMMIAHGEDINDLV